MKKKIKILHLMGRSQSNYNEKFFNFIIKNQVLNKNIEHVFVSSGQNKSIISGKHKFYVIYFDENPVKLIRIIGYFNIIRLIKLSVEAKKADLIIIHGLFNPRYLIFLTLFQGFLKKTRWVIWGGDLYGSLFLDSKKTFHNLFDYAIRKRIAQNIDAIITSILEDWEFAQNYFHTNVKRIEAFYPNPIDFDLLESSVKLKNKNNNVQNILLGNSATPTNEHLEVLDFLSSMKIRTKFKVLCPLSYGNKEYASFVVEYGKERLGNDFIPLLELLKPKEYAKVLNSVDVAIMNHRRQQGRGNILALLYAGKKVYISKSVSTYSFLERLGIIIFDTNKLIKYKDCKNLFKFNQNDGEKNKEIIKKEYSEENCASHWAKIFYQ